jgi:hypothetical protein
MKDFFKSFPLRLFLWNSFWCLTIIFTLLIIKWDDPSIRTGVYGLVFIGIFIWSVISIWLIKNTKK